MSTLNMSYTINLDGGSQLLGFSSLMSIVLLIFALAAIIAIIKALAVLIPGAAIARADAQRAYRGLSTRTHRPISLV